MKIATSITVCLLILICHSSDGQDASRTAEASRIAEEVRHIDVKIDIPGGFGSVLISEQPSLYFVQLPVGGGSSFKEHSAPDVSSLHLQMWLLKADGSSVPRSEKPNLIDIGNAGWDTDYMVYTFNKVPSNHLAGIVLQVNGKLYCQEIEAKGK